MAARAMAGRGDSVLPDLLGRDVEVEEEEEGEIREREIILLTVRSVTIVLLILGSVLLTRTVWRRGRGSWREAAGAVSLQIVWQVLAWYHVHVDQHWVLALSLGTPDHETTRKIFQFAENLFHGLAVYSGLVVVGRLGAVVGALLYILSGMAILIPLLFSLIILLLDIYLNAENRLSDTSSYVVAAGTMVLMDLVPLGLLLAWGIGQCRAGSDMGRKGSREVASTVIAVMLVLWHLTSLAQWVVYTVSKASGDVILQVELSDYDRGLVEASYLLACLALPWAWLLGLCLPTGPGARRSSMDELDHNLKTAKQNERRNVVVAKYKKENGDFPLATPPTSPQRFSPSVTSSPSVHSASGSINPVALPPHLTPTTPAKGLPPRDQQGKATPKRRSYMEAVSGSQLNMNPMDEEEPASKVTPRRSYMTAVSNSEINLLEDAPPRHSRSADPLWLPTSLSLSQIALATSKPIQL